MPLQIIDHPLASHVLSGLRDKQTNPDRFRRLADIMATLLILEATRGMATVESRVETPLEQTASYALRQGLAVVPILRAGLALLEPAIRLFPDVSVGYIGLERSHETAVAQSYFCKLPPLAGRYTLCCDPMLATGGSASQALEHIKLAGATRIAMVCVVASPEGVAVLEKEHPDVSIYTATLDRGLDKNKFIIPGLGDFGDRLYGTE